MVDAPNIPGPLDPTVNAPKDSNSGTQHPGTFKPTSGGEHQVAPGQKAIIPGGSKKK